LEISDFEPQRGAHCPQIMKKSAAGRLQACWTELEIPPGGPAANFQLLSFFAMYRQSRPLLRE
jgi:hypothetical protein